MIDKPFDNTTNPAQMRGVAAPDGTTKARIERAALELFAQHEIDGVSTKQIAARAGISEGGIYRHFTSKEALAKAMMLAIHNRLTAMIQSAHFNHARFTDQIDAIVRQYCHIADDDWTLFQYHMLHLHHFPKLSDSPHNSPIGAATKMVGAAMQRGDMQAGNAVLFAAMALGIVTQSAQAKMFGYLDGPLSDHIESFNHAIKAALGLSPDPAQKEA